MREPDDAAVLELTYLDEAHFGALTEGYRRELQVHCYRLMGSIEDAEDMVQETYLRAWGRRATYAGRASLRAWLYKIATNVCLDALKKRARRVVPLTYQDEADVDAPIPPHVLEPIWLEPYPDALLPGQSASPESIVTAREHSTLAFMTLLHRLPPRQRAVLILREVLDWSAQEVADLLATTVPAVKAALHRARATLAAYQQGERALLPAQPLDEPIQTQLAAYVRAWEAADITALLQLLTEDATFSMPPIPAWYRGRATIGRLTARTVFSGQAAGRWRLLPTRANRQPAFGLYRQTETPGEYSAYGIQVLTFDQAQIADIITFRLPALFAHFGLPPALP